VKGTVRLGYPSPSSSFASSGSSSSTADSTDSSLGWITLDSAAQLLPPILKASSGWAHNQLAGYSTLPSALQLSVAETLS
jgi:hypothetical protein